MTDGEPETAVSAILQKIKLIKNQQKHFVFIFYFIKSQTSDSFVNHFDCHFAYLKTLDFSFKVVWHAENAVTIIIIKYKTNIIIKANSYSAT